MTNINFTNFHDATVATFTKCAIPARAPDYASASGSAYWNTTEGVIRQSDHWVGLEGCNSQRSCAWSLEGATDNMSAQELAQLVEQFGGLEVVATETGISVSTLEKMIDGRIKKVSGSTSSVIRSLGKVEYAGYCAYADFEQA